MLLPSGREDLWNTCCPLLQKPFRREILNEHVCSYIWLDIAFWYSTYMVIYRERHRTLDISISTHHGYCYFHPMHG